MGRAGILEQARILLGRIQAKRPEKSILLTGLRGVDVPNVNFNKRMDLLWRADQWIINHVAPDLDITPEDFLWAKSNSFFKLDVPKADNFPEGCDTASNYEGDNE